MAQEKKNIKIKKDQSEEPLIDKLNEGLKKLISKGKKQGFLNYSEIEDLLSNEQSEDKEEFYSKVDSLNIQIFNNENEDNISEDEPSNNSVVKEKDEDTGRTDDPVRMYLKEMGNVELLSRVGEIEIAKRIENGKKKTLEAFSKCFVSMNLISDFIASYKKSESQLRDFVDLDSTFRSVNGEQEDFNDLEIKDSEIFDNVEDDESEEKDDENDFEDSENTDENSGLSDLSILEKEENLRPHIEKNLDHFLKSFKKLKKLKLQYLNSLELRKKTSSKEKKKIDSNLDLISETVKNIFVNNKFKKA